ATVGSEGSVALLAIDAGTSGLKVAVYDDLGEQAAFASTGYAFLQGEEGTPELHAAELWTVLRNMVRKATKDAPASTIKAVSISSHGESFVPIGSDGKPLSPFILNIDSRATEEVAELVAEIGKERLYRTTGLPPHAMYTIPKIAWLKRHEPALFEKTQKFLCIEDFLLHRAGIGAYISTSLASRTMGLDLVRGGWSQRILGKAGIDADILGQPVPSGTPLGRASPQVAEELNLPREALWVSGGHDQACCSLGGGGLSEGTAVDGTGTFECLTIARKHPSFSPQALAANFPCEKHIVPAHFLTLAYVPGGLVLQWTRDQLSKAEVILARNSNRNPYDIMLASTPEAPTELLFFPHLLGTGTPWLDTTARGTIYGLAANTTHAMIVKSSLEGVTFEMRWNIDLLEAAGISIKQIHAVGGGARSRVWLQLKADIFGRDVVSVAGEASCIGAAICAGIGAGIYSSWQEGAATLVKPTESFQPHSVTHKRYQELFEQYKHMANCLYGYQPTVYNGHPLIQEAV
ncbi:MAG: FGGY-family carbohydrate kinase, partial [Acidobacteriota bacterium]